VPSEVLAPKLSALQRRFERRDLRVIALYIETCDGVPDHAAELRRQIAKHRIDYPALDAEAGVLDDPTRERFPWAPHALVVDVKGRIVRTYGHLPRLRTLEEDLESLVATGVLPERPDDGWREFPRNAWARVRTEGNGRPREEKLTLSVIGADGIQLRGDDRTVRLPHEDVGRTRVGYRREEVGTESIEIGGRKIETRRFRASWTAGEAKCAEDSWTANGAILRRETRTTAEDGAVATRVETLVAFAEPAEVGGQSVVCRVFERTETWKGGSSRERLWTSKDVPGHLVRRERETVQDGRRNSDSERVVDFGLR